MGPPQPESNSSDKQQQQQQQQHLVFVYGTLKTGEPNEAWMRDPERGSAELVGTGRTVKK